jgi:hypothetical protein
VDARFLTVDGQAEALGPDLALDRRKAAPQARDARCIPRGLSLAVALQAPVGGQGLADQALALVPASEDVPARVVLAD